MWNKNERDGKIDQAKGRAKQAVGDLTGNEKMKAEGELDEAGGAVVLPGAKSPAAPSSMAAVTSAPHRVSGPTDSLRGEFFCSTLTKCWPDSGTVRAVPVTMRRAVCLVP